ncbi:unnamed protein product [Phytophthora fragariaefolia]|uniref:Unnamed protein product n=1 Tax=Phytophthora fragariaefolia TaxID=1490495 RepID=A0A9W7DA58_9STRA|nr:unnamed protein product [Phytophthora fragariaefolia]
MLLPPRRRQAPNSAAGSRAPRATEPSEGESAPANTTASEPTPVVEAAVPSPDGASDARQAEDFLNSSDSQDPKSSVSTTSPDKAPQEPSSPPADGPDPVDYEESEPDQDRKQGEVPDPEDRRRCCSRGGSISAPVSSRHCVHCRAGAADPHERRCRRGGSTGTTAARQPKAPQCAYPPRGSTSRRH